jgi:hypothetical protein
METQGSRLLKSWLAALQCQNLHVPKPCGYIDLEAIVSLGSESKLSVYHPRSQLTGPAFEHLGLFDCEHD